MNTPAGRWLNKEDEAEFNRLWDEGDSDDLVLSMMNLAWYALTYLSVATKDTDSAGTEAEWLQRIAIDLEAEG